MDEHEHKIIAELSRNSAASQRHLSKVSDLSLGMVNMVLHRLIEKGYMKIKQLDGRKVQYILTPKGFSEKIKRSKQYVSRTVSLLSAMKEAVKQVIIDHRSRGISKICVLGRGELLSVIELAAKELSFDDIYISRADGMEKVKPGTQAVFCLTEMPQQKNGGLELVDIMQKIAESMG